GARHRFSGDMMTRRREQYGALPFRLRGGEAETLLVTSLETGRWVIPQGWPQPGETFAAAAREAFEEAGIRGRLLVEPIGSYDYVKRLTGGCSLLCTVTVHLMEVEQEFQVWPESTKRERRWFAAEQAAESVAEPELRDLMVAAKAMIETME